MKNVTITLDEEVARWARVHAAIHETSVSRLVGEMLRQRMLAERGYGASKEQFFAIAPRPLDLDDTPLPTRDELHDRDRLR